MIDVSLHPKSFNDNVERCRVEKVSQDLATEFPAVKVRFVNLTLPSAEKNGCLRHPNVQGHKAMFEQLEPVLSDLTGWK